MRRATRRSKFQDGGTWVKKVKVWNTSSPTKGCRKATAREHETIQRSSGITETTNSTNAYVFGKFNAK